MIRCKLFGHNYDSIEPTQEQRDSYPRGRPGNRPYLWMHGLRCKRCGFVLKEPYIPGIMRKLGSNDS